jgi:hypothetical protein
LTRFSHDTDLLGEMHRHQSEEFVIRGRVLPAQEVIASTTSVAARLCRMEGQIGTVAAGAYADLIVVDGDPLQDLSLLTRQGADMAGSIVKNQLASTRTDKIELDGCVLLDVRDAPVATSFCSAAKRNDVPRQETHAPL